MYVYLALYFVQYSIHRMQWFWGDHWKFSMVIWEDHQWFYNDFLSGYHCFSMISMLTLTNQYDIMNAIQLNNCPSVPTSLDVLVTLLKTLLRFFFQWIWFLDIQNRFYFIVKRLKNAFLMHFQWRGRGGGHGWRHQWWLSRECQGGVIPVYKNLCCEFCIFWRALATWNWHRKGLLRHIKNEFFSLFTMKKNLFWISRNHIQWKKSCKSVFNKFTTYLYKTVDHLTCGVYLRRNCSR